jgi:hypothetical protein
MSSKLNKTELEAIGELIFNSDFQPEELIEIDDDDCNVETIKIKLQVLQELRDLIDNSIAKYYDVKIEDDGNEDLISQLINLTQDIYFVIDNKEFILQDKLDSLNETEN